MTVMNPKAISVSGYLADTFAPQYRHLPFVLSQLMSQGQADAKDESEETAPNPFSQLTDQELEEYKKEVERKKLELEGK